MCIPWGRTRTLLQVWILFHGSSSLVSASPSFLDERLFGYALWDSGKVMNIDVYSLQTRYGDTERLPCPGAKQSPARFHHLAFHWTLLHIVLHREEGSLTFIFVISSIFSRRNSIQVLFIVAFRQVLCCLNCVIVRTVPCDVNRNFFKKYYMNRSV